MLRRLIVAGLAAGLAAPAFIVTPASATVLFSCSTMEGPTFPIFPGGPLVTGAAEFWFDPGLSHTQTAQDASYGYIKLKDCSNGDSTPIRSGDTNGYDPTVSYPPRPIGCPVSLGGTGPDYADQTPILLSGANGFSAQWTLSGLTSHGLVKVKAGPVGDQYRFIFNITSGMYAPPAGQKTKIKFTATISADPLQGFFGYSYTCADDSDPLEAVALGLVGSVIVNQK